MGQRTSGTGKNSQPRTDLCRLQDMDLIIQKLLADIRTLMADFWDALWHPRHPLSPSNPPASTTGPASSESAHPVA